MKLGILVNSNDHAVTIVGLTNAALAQGHEVIIFAMDAGTRLLEDIAFIRLATHQSVSMSFCDHSARELGVKTGGLSSRITASSQLSNAEMNKKADHVLVL